MLANQPKNDTLYIKGFNIVVENRAFTYRQVAQNVGQKVCLMPAHYGYLQNNPKVGVFVGAFPENDTVYLINQKAQGGYFDKHIAMFGFLSEQQAVDTYQKCFEYGYIGLMSVIPCTIEQLKWWLANGDKSRPVTKERLPYAGLERLDSVIWGGQEGTDLASHGGQVAKLLYQIRQSDNFNHALEPLSYHDLTQELGNQGFVYENYDALVIEYNKLERKAKQLLMAMQGAADIVKPVGVAVSKPLNKGGVSNVVAWFEMDDGQAVGVFFHNPDKTPKKIDPTDEMISYKWVLNKKDITIVVAPENGKDLVVRTVAKRIMKLVDANHDRFLKANSAKAELNVKEQELNAQVIDKQAELDALNKDIEALEAKKETRQSGEQLLNTGYDGVKAELKSLSWVDDPIVQGGLVKSFIGTQESGDTNPDGISSISINRNGVNIAAKVGADTIIPNSVEIIPQYGLNVQSKENYKKIADKINNAVEAYVAKRREAVNTVAVSPVVEPEPINLTGKELENPTLSQERPSNWRTNLANARAVAKSLGIETKGKKLVDLLTEIDQKDTEPKATTVSNKKSVDNALSRKETERQEAESRAEVEGMTNNHKELDARIDALDSKALGYLGVFLNYSTTNPTEISEKAKLENYENLKAALDKLDDAMAQDEIRQKLAQIEKQPNREDALALAIKLTKEMPDEAEKIRMSLSLAIATNKWKGIEVKLPQQSPKLKTDAEVLASIKRLQKSFEGTEFRLNISKANTDYIKGVLIKGTGSSMSSQEFSYFNNKGFDLGYIEYRNQFDLDTFNPILKAIEKWLQGEIVPSFFVGIDDDWDMDIMATPLKIKEALDKAAAEGLAIAKQAKENSAQNAQLESAVEKLSKFVGNTKFDSWAKKYNVDEQLAQTILDLDVGRFVVSSLIQNDLPPNLELISANDSGLYNYWSAKPETVKGLSQEAFNVLAQQDNYGEDTAKLAYTVLRFSDKKSEFEYVASLGAMKNSARIKSQDVGGKLYNMAQQYLESNKSSQQPSEPEPTPATSEPAQTVSEPPMTNPDRDLLGFATMAALSTQTKQERDKKKSPDFVANTLAEKWTKALNGDSKAIKDIRDYFVSNKRVPNMTKAHLIILEGLTGQDFNSKTYEYVVQKFDDYINTITQSQEPVATNPDRDYLQSIIDGSMTPKSSDMDVVIALTGKYETDEDMIPLLEQALEKINQTQQAAVKEVA